MIHKKTAYYYRTVETLFSEQAIIQLFCYSFGKANIQDKIRSVIPYKDFRIFWESLNASYSLGLLRSSSERNALLIG